MAIKHNQQIPNNHFRKDWQRRVRVHFDQAGKKRSRREARQQKAALSAPRPIDKLRPIVRCPTIKYNMKVRAGRGFSLAELKAAGIPRQLAKTIGIAVDPRRQNLSEEGLKVNVERLLEYKKRLILFPRRAGKHKSGDASKDEVTAAKAQEGIVTSIGSTLTITNKVEIQEGAVADYQTEGGAYRKLRLARSDARLVGVRAKRAAEKAEQEAAKKK